MLITEMEDNISNIGKHYRVKFLDDYKQEVLLILYEKGIDFLKELEDKEILRSYVYKCCLLMLYSKQSKYYKTYLFPDQNFAELNGTEIKHEKKFSEQRLTELIDNLTGMDKILLQQLILCRGNKKSFSKKSNISYSTISLMINNLSIKIKENWELEDFYE